jgi:hypothetical protein
VYVGDLVPLTHDRIGGPYFIETHRNRQAIDAARTNTGEGRWVNDPRGSGKRPNCKFSRGRAGAFYVVTSRRIRAGEELYVSYGRGYWRYHSVGQEMATTARGDARMGQLEAPRKGPVEEAPIDLTAAASQPPPAAGTALHQQIRTAAAADSAYQALTELTRSSPAEADPVYTIHEGLLLHRGLPVIANNRELRRQLLTEAHDTAASGHTGVAATYDRLRTRVYWPAMQKDVHDYVTTCDACQRNKVEQRKTAGLLRPPAIPDVPGYAINMDFVTGLPPTPRGHTAYLSITCRLSNLLQVGLCSDSVTAPQAAQLVFDNWVLHYGLPAVIISDRDPRFTGHFWRELWRLLDTSLAMSTAGHPQTDGKAENRQRTANTMLRAFVDFDQTDWDLKLRNAVFAINHTRSASTGMTPFEVMLGRHARLPLDAALEPLRRDQPAAGRAPAVEEFLGKHRELWAHAKARLESAQADQKKFADRHRREELYRVGDQVLLSTKDLVLAHAADIKRAAKFSAKFVGPFAVKAVINDNAYELELPEQLRIHPVQNVSKLRRYKPSPAAFEGRPVAAPRPPPDMVDPAGDAHYEVERILAERRTGPRGQRVEYLVKWLGYPNEDCSWVAKADLDSPELLRQFRALQHVQLAHREAPATDLTRYGVEPNPGPSPRPGTPDERRLVDAVKFKRGMQTLTTRQAALVYRAAAIRPWRGRGVPHDPQAHHRGWDLLKRIRKIITAHHYVRHWKCCGCGVNLRGDTYAGRARRYCSDCRRFDIYEERRDDDSRGPRGPKPRQRFGYDPADGRVQDV